MACSWAETQPPSPPRSDHNNNDNLQFIHYSISITYTRAHANSLKQNERKKTRTSFCICVGERRLVVFSFLLFCLPTASLQSHISESVVNFHWIEKSGDWNIAKHALTSVSVSVGRHIPIICRMKSSWELKKNGIQRWRATGYRHEHEKNFPSGDMRFGKIWMQIHAISRPSTNARVKEFPNRWRKMRPPLTDQMQ